MTAPVAVGEPRELMLVTVEELMSSQEDGLDTVRWRLVGTGKKPDPEVGWMASQVPGTYTVGQLHHLLTLTYKRETGLASRCVQGAGLEFKVVARGGRYVIVSSADAVRHIFSTSRMPPANGLVRRPRLPVGLSDAMRLQSEHQVGLDAAML